MVMTDKDRFEKNSRIKATREATIARHAAMKCKVLDLKLSSKKMTIKQKDALNSLFREAKWCYNSMVASGIQGYDTKAKTVQVKLPSGDFETREYSVLGNQVRQFLKVRIRSNLTGLRVAKLKGRKAGKLRFVSTLDSVPLMQYGITYSLRGDSKNRLKIQNIPGQFTVLGHRQLADVDEITNANLVRKADGYHLLVTTFTSKDKLRKKDLKSTPIGVDFGVKTALTLSDGREFNHRIEESERLKKLQRKHARQQKDSKNSMKTLAKLNREYLKLSYKKDDLANKIVSQILAHEHVYIQDENISSWRRKKSKARGSRAVQHGVLGRVKAKLVNHPRVTVHGRWVPTTAWCHLCGVVTPHSLDKRIFECSGCGFSEPRDIHAALNMVRLSEDSNLFVPEGLGEVTPVETSASAEGVSASSVSSVVEAGNRSIGGRGVDTSMSSAST